MKLKISFITIAVTILFGSLFLSIVKPALEEITVHPEEGYSLRIDYGIPTKWFRHETENVPAGCPFIKDSVGLDFTCVETALRSDGLKTAAYIPRYRGDPFDRPLRYPPLHLLVFVWILLLRSQQAVGLWCLLSFTLTFVCALFWFEWSRKLCGASDAREENLPSGLFLASLFAVSYPAIFQFERGQTDSVVLALFSGSAYFFIKERWFWAGALASLAALFKVYPVFISLPLILLGILQTVRAIQNGRADLKKSATALLAGTAVGILSVFILLGPQYCHYFKKVLIPYAQADEMPPECVNYHSLHTAFGGWGLGFWGGLWALLSAGFIITTLRQSVSREAGDRFSPGSLFFLAMLASFSVFVAKTSYDYNLILMVPLFAMLINGGLGDKGLWIKWGGSLTLLGFALPRWLQDFLAPDLYPLSAFLVFQVAGLAILGIAGWSLFAKRNRA